MSENPVPSEQGPQVIDFSNVTVIGLSGGSGIISINGNATPAQHILAGQGISVIDAGANHTVEVKLAPLPSGLDFDGVTQGLFAATNNPVFLDPITGGVDVSTALGITKNNWGPNLELTGQNIFLRYTTLLVNLGVNNDVSIITAALPNVPCSGLLINPTIPIAGAVTITGFGYHAVFPGPPRIPSLSTDLYVSNFTGFPMMFSELDGGSDVVNQIFTGIGSIVVFDQTVTHFYYDTDKQRWQYVSCSQKLASDFLDNTLAFPVSIPSAVVTTVLTTTGLVPGLYHFVGQAQWEVGLLPGVLSIQIHVNGTRIAEQSLPSLPFNGTDTPVQNVSIVFPITSIADVVTLEAFQNTAGALTISASPTLLESTRL